LIWRRQHYHSAQPVNAVGFEVLPDEDPAHRMRHEMNFVRLRNPGVPKGIADGWCRELANGGSARRIIDVQHNKAFLLERFCHFGHRGVRAAQSVEQNDAFRCPKRPRHASR